MGSSMRLVLISDTHNFHDRITPLPDGDLLIHAGDLTERGTFPELAECFDWFGQQPHRYKVLIAGNHDFGLERQPEACERLIPPGVSYLRDSGVEAGGLRIWGAPWQPTTAEWAFHLRRGPEIARRWALIPLDTQVLVTHGPPQGVLDLVRGPAREHAGCEALLARLAELPALRLHVFGHIHESHGRVETNGLTSVNASICDADYVPRNPPVVVDL